MTAIQGRQEAIEVGCYAKAFFSWLEETEIGVRFRLPSGEIAAMEFQLDVDCEVDDERLYSIYAAVVWPDGSKEVVFVVAITARTFGRILAVEWCDSPSNHEACRVARIILERLWGGVGFAVFSVPFSRSDRERLFVRLNGIGDEWKKDGLEVVFTTR